MQSAQALLSALRQLTFAELRLTLQTERPEGKQDMVQGRGVLLDIPRTWRSGLGHGAMYVVASAAALALVVKGIPGDSPEEAIDVAMAGAALLQAIAVLGLADLLASVVVRHWGTTPPNRIIVGLLSLIVVGGFAVGLPLSFHLIEYMSLVRDFGSPVEKTVWATPVTLSILVGVTWMRHSMVASWERRLADEAGRTREAQQARKLAEAELAMLQAQIEPHFLYNTLASVQYLIRRDSGGADILITQLIRYLRHAMPKLRQPMSTLQQEFELADAYLQIARMRMGGRLTTSVELAETLHALPFPPLILQTLVENALKHGVEPKPGPVAIQVSAHVVEATGSGSGRLVLAVRDNGVGFGQANTAGTGAGLASVRERLAAIYGGVAQLAVSDILDGGVESSVTLNLPRPQSVARPRDAAVDTNIERQAARCRAR